VILNVAYGWQVTSNDDYFVRLMEEAFSIHNAINKPSGWLVEFFPIRRFLRTLGAVSRILLMSFPLPVRFLPSWFAGNTYKRRAAYFKHRMWDIDNVPHRWAKEKIVSGDMHLDRTIFFSDCVRFTRNLVILYSPSPLNTFGQKTGTR